MRYYKGQKLLQRYESDDLKIETFYDKYFNSYGIVAINKKDDALIADNVVNVKSDIYKLFDEYMHRYVF